MSEQNSIPLQARPDGEAELRLVLQLRWEDVAALGQEASRLAARLQRPVSLDEAVSHKLRARSATGAHAAPSGQERAQQPAAVATPVALSGRSSPTDQAQEAIAKINGSAEARGVSEVRRTG
jgi:hypothetical protein